MMLRLVVTAVAALALAAACSADAKRLDFPRFRVHREVGRYGR
jgi:hypothetical protein